MIADLVSWFKRTFLPQRYVYIPRHVECVDCHLSTRLKAKAPIHGFGVFITCKACLGSRWVHPCFHEDGDGRFKFSVILARHFIYLPDQYACLYCWDKLEMDAREAYLCKTSKADYEIYPEDIFGETV